MTETKTLVYPEILSIYNLLTKNERLNTNFNVTFEQPVHHRGHQMDQNKIRAFKQEKDEEIIYGTITSESPFDPPWSESKPRKMVKPRFCVSYHYSRQKNPEGCPIYNIQWMLPNGSSEKVPEPLIYCVGTRISEFRRKIRK